MTLREELRNIFGDYVSSKRLIQYNRDYYRRACAGELTRSTPKSWDLREPNGKTAPTQVTVSVPKNTYAEIEKRFSMLNILGDAIVKGNMNALMVAGAPGVGKTYELEKKLEKAMNDNSITSYVSIKGTVSAIELYKTQYENKNRGQVIVLDDVDRIYGDEEAMNILKAALDSSVVRKVCWMKASRFLEEDGIPNSFEYEGQVVFITNVNPDRIIAKEGRMSPHMNALVSRSVFLDLCIHEADEILMRIEQVLLKSTLKDDLNIDDVQASMILDWMKSKSKMLRSVSIRTVLQVAGFLKTSPENWVDIAEATLVKRF
jgi:hypothetical protein